MMRLVLSLLLAAQLDMTLSSAVVELTDEDFKSRIDDYETALVMFYAPWCGHCKQLKPKFESAADQLVKNDPPVQLLKVDCTAAGKATCDSFGVSGYPTLKIFKGGSSKEYSGPRDADGIVAYMANQVGPAVKELASRKEFDDFVASPADNRVVGFFEGSPDLKRAYLQAAETFREKFKFGMTGLPELVDNNSRVVLFRPTLLKNVFEPSQIVYEGKVSKLAVETWLTDNIHGLVDLRTRDNADEFKAPLVVAYFDVDYTRNPKGTNYWRNRILKVAKDFASDFTFAISSNDEFQREFEEFGREYDPASDKPVVFATKDKKKFPMSEEFSVENFTSFLTKLKNNELRPFFKSEPVPADNDGPVKVAVTANFDDVVTNNGRDTFVEFYAPWCGHCQKLAPVWKALGEKMTEEDVDVVKMNAVDNDVPEPYQVRGFPTIYWVPKDRKSAPVAYEGDRTLEDFVKYVAKHAADELKNYNRKGESKKKDEL